MNKRVFSFVVALLLMVCFATPAFAADGSIVESPDVKIIINGKTSTYTDAPLIVGKETFIPLGEVMVNLGVDKNNIKQSGKVISIVSGNANISLKIGSRIGTVNSKMFSLSKPPFVYKKNNKVYVPLRFISEALGKKVVMAGSSSAVFIRDNAEYQAVRRLLTESNMAMSKVKKYKVGMNMDMNIDSGNEALGGFGAIKASVAMTAAYDLAMGNLYTKTSMNIPPLLEASNSEIYFVDNTMYSQDSLTGSWYKIEMSESEFKESYSTINIEETIAVEEVLCAALVIDDKTNKDEIILKGNVLLESLLGSVAGEYGSSITGIEETYIELHMDKNTKESKSMIMTMKGSISDEIMGKMTIDLRLDLNFSDLNGNFEVTVPDDVKEKAVGFDFDFDF